MTELLKSIFSAYNTAIEGLNRLSISAKEHVLVKGERGFVTLQEFKNSYPPLNPIGIYLEEICRREELATFSFFDYKPFPLSSEIKAFYIILNGNKKDFEKYQMNLDILYTDTDKQIRKFIFDSNKLLRLTGRYDTFIVSKGRAETPPTAAGEFYITYDQNIISENNDDDGANKIEKIYKNYVRKENQEREHLLRCFNLESIKADLSSKQREVDNILYEDVFAAFFTYLHFISMIAPANWKEYIYYPCSILTPDSKVQWIGGLLLAYTKPTSFVERLAFRHTINSLISCVYTQPIYKTIENASTRSAISAIMSRNLSHNIGSHVLSAIGETYISSNAKQVNEFNNYLQRRMDLLARIVGDRPGWGEPMFFIGDLLNEFFNQSLLLGNLISDLGAWNIMFQICLPTGKRHQFVYDNDDNDKKHKKWICPDPIDDFMVSIPDGLIGAQAFFVFIESMIRNSAKYGKGKADQRDFIIHIDVAENAEYYKLTVCDNFSLCNGDVVSGIQDKIREPVVDSQGVLSTRSLGIAEMREACNFLIHPYGEDYPAFKDTDNKVYPLWAECPGLTDCSTDQGGAFGRCSIHCDCNHLTYTFNLAKPQMIGLVNYEGALPEGSIRLGIDKIDYNLLVTKRGTYQFVVIYNISDEIQNFINDNIHLLPQRMLIANHNGEYSKGRSSLKQRAAWCPTEEINFQDTPEKLLISVYEAWIRNKWLMKKDACLYITSEREESNAFFKKWKPQIERTRVLNDKISLRLISTYKAGEIGIKEIAEREAATDADYSEWMLLLYDDHKSLSNHDEELKSRTFFVHNIGSSNKKIFETISAPSAGEFAFDFFLLGLIEAALTKVVIIDERVASNSIRAEGKNSDCNHLLALNECHCYPVLFLDNENLNGITDKVESQFKKVAECSAEVVNIEATESIDADFVIIHYGLMETHQSTLGQVDILQRIAPSVVIATGRGAGTIKDESIKKMPFLEFSAIQSNCYPAISKYHLVRALMSTKGGI